ncbi:unnamed protein product [Allacma fusca]|uniref:Elongation of very long chain fatty acids protein n=1 Tax=Allacma fusca TaxID=39272 RepID=A0A8J2NV43_9HEXA|nr:unnamed protein product [Allacma fusca]
METAEVVKAMEKTSGYITAYDFEVYDVAWAIDQTAVYRNYMYLSIGIYLFLVYFGQKWMKNRPAYVLKYPLFFWNAGLAIFSIISTIRGTPEILYTLSSPEGTYKTICVGTPHNYATSFWAYLFVLSKLVEFGDTAFIVLRKQKLITLHWFHHVTTLLLTWLAMEHYDALGRVFVINTFIHSIMYSYYALKALKVKIPKRFAKSLTTLQIIQMFMVIYINFSSVYFMAMGRPCKRNINVVYLSGIIIPIFAYLFIQFFRKTYLRPAPRTVKSD